MEQLYIDCATCKQKHRDISNGSHSHLVHKSEWGSCQSLHIDTALHLLAIVLGISLHSQTHSNIYITVWFTKPRAETDIAITDTLYIHLLVF